MVTLGKQNLPINFKTINMEVMSMYDKNYTRLHLGDKVNFSDEYGNKCSQIMSFTPTGNIIVRKDRYSPMEVLYPRECELNRDRRY